jgi:hypothetical protein
MKKLAMSIAAAGLAAASLSAMAWWGPGYDRNYGGYAPYYAYSPYGYAPNLTEEQIQAQKDAIEAQQKAALEHFQRMEEQRKAMQAPMTEEQIKQMQAQREAMQKAMEERHKALFGPMAEGPFGMMEDPMMMQDPMMDEGFKQMEAERDAMRAAMEERRKSLFGPMTESPYGMRRPVDEEYFKQMEDRRLAMQKSMQEQREAMQNFHQERMKQRQPAWDYPYGPAW